MPQPEYQNDGVRLYFGDCIEMMRAMPKCSVDTIITDPPYHLTQASRNGSSRKPGTGPFGRVNIGERGFMGKTWDGGGIAFDPKMWATALRVAKSGAMLLAFGGTRTFHRLTCAIEDAGWEIRDCLMWLYGSGFPKSHNIGNHVDRRQGCPNRGHAIASGSKFHPTTGEARAPGEHLPKYEGRTPEGKRWEGWGTALKPAWEPIILAMKPLDGTFATNAQKHGVAGLNIEWARIDLQGGYKCRANGRPSQTGLGDKYDPDAANQPDTKGRWPANVILSHHAECEAVGTKRVKSNGHYPAKRGNGGLGTSGHKGQIALDEQHTSGETIEVWECHQDCPVRLLDEQSGMRKAGGNLSGNEPSPPLHTCYGKMSNPRKSVSHGDMGGASRFFYCAKASTTERSVGLPAGMVSNHPTVKPVRLMEYLCKLTASPTGGVVLDPFAGSGTTLLAAKNVGRECIGIEIDPGYVKIATHRLKSLIKHSEKGGAVRSLAA